MTHNLAKILLPVACAVAIAAPVASRADTWTFTSSQVGYQDGNLAKPTYAGSGSIGVGVQGWADAAQNGSGTGSSGNLASQTLRVWDGLAVDRKSTCYSNGYCNQYSGESSPYHAVSNALDSAIGDTRQVFEMVLLSFDQAVTLSSLDLGWLGSDSDVTVLAYNPTTDGTAPAGGTAPNLAGTSYSNMISSGWDLVGNYLNVGQYGGNPNPVSINTGNASQSGTYLASSSVYTSSYWLVGAYNSILSGNSYANGADYFKIAAVTGAPGTPGCTSNCGGPPPPGPGVPEPASLGLLLAGFPLLRRYAGRSDGEGGAALAA